MFWHVLSSARTPGWVLGAMKKLTAMPSQCWICREQVDGLEDAVMVSEAVPGGARKYKATQA